MKQAHLNDLREATSASELLDAFVVAGNDLGFGIGSMAMTYGSLANVQPGKSVHNIPEAWIANATNMDMAKADPVFVKLQTSREPFFYDQTFYVKSGCADLWEESAAFGISAGVCASIHLPGERRLFWGFDGPSLPRSDKTRTQLLAATQLLGVFALSSAERLLCAEQQAALSEAQLAVLRYTRDGHSSWVIARLLEMTEDNVNYHLKRCRAKLGVATKHQAVHKAMELGLLT
ncbi:MAG: hypothetical protein E6R08_09075 [Nevskiaceae bacterium]|nr:MAG: hypothetical protein E6R08_09075 [Nevskiaceae bacterium]